MPSPRTPTESKRLSALRTNQSAKKAGRSTSKPSKVSKPARTAKKAVKAATKAVKAIAKKATKAAAPKKKNVVLRTYDAATAKVVGKSTEKWAKSELSAGSRKME